MVMVCEKDAIQVVPLDPDARDQAGEAREKAAAPESFAFPEGGTMSIARPAALVKHPVPEWPFWKTGACEPAVVSYEGPSGAWAAEYRPLTASGRLTQLSPK